MLSRVSLAYLKIDPHSSVFIGFILVARRETRMAKKKNKQNQKDYGHESITDLMDSHFSLLDVDGIDGSALISFKEMASDEEESDIKIRHFPAKEVKKKPNINDLFKENMSFLDKEIFREDKESKKVKQLQAIQNRDTNRSSKDQDHPKGNHGNYDEVYKNNIEYQVYKSLLERHQFRVHNDDVYIYKSKMGYFKKLTSNELKVLIRDGWNERIEMQLNKYKVDDVIDRIKGTRSLQIDSNSFDQHDDFVNFKNQVLCVISEELYDHSAKFNFKSFINANYDPNIKEKKGKVFRKFIDQCTEGDTNKIKLLQEICGYAFSNYSNAKKFFVFIGKPHTGKSTLLDILKEIIGSEYTSAIPLHKLGDRFMTANLFEAKLNISGELNEGELKGLNTIKSLTGNDDLIAERKGKDPFVFKNRSKLIFAGNHMPLLKRLDSTSAFFDRIIFVMFNNSIPEDQRDLNLKEKMLEEKDYIVSWAIKGLRRLISNNFIFTSCDESLEFKNQYIQDVNTAFSFIESCCDINRHNKDFRVHKKDLYGAYSKYCVSNCLIALNKTEFFNQLNSMSFEKKKFRFKGSIPLEGYIGIALKEDR